MNKIMPRRDKQRAVFLTGATGVLGSHILKLILDETSFHIILLIRGNGYNEVRRRCVSVLENLYCSRHLNIREKMKRITLINGDLETFGLRKRDKVITNLHDMVSEIYHCAALAEFNKPLPEVRRVNVDGTRRILEFAQKCKRLNKINYISTAFIAGKSKGSFAENQFNINQRFNNAYEQSKFEAEGLVRAYIKQGIRVAIFRPSIIVGEYDTGRINQFRMFYQPLRLFSSQLIKKIPVNHRTVLNIIPCDIAARAIFKLSVCYDVSDVYNIVHPKSFSIIYLMKFASKFYGYKEPQYVKPELFCSKELTTIYEKMLEPYIPFFTFQAIFESRKTQKDLAKIGFKYPNLDENFLTRLFKYVGKCGYIKYSGK